MKMSKIYNMCFFCENNVYKRKEKKYNNMYKIT